jgi:flagellar hook-associated protein 2
VEGGALRLTSGEYGSAAGFTVSYADAGGEDPATQLGLAAATYDNGLDAAGTLDGIALTGAGQLLTAANGLVMRYTGSAATATSTMRYARGLGGSLALSAETMLAQGSGTIALQKSSAERGISSLERRETDILARMERRRATLVADFTRMETLLGRLQGQGSWLTSQIGSIQNISAANARG